MKKMIQKNIPALLSVGVLGVGIVSANIAEIPNLSSVSAGEIIRATDVQDLSATVTALDKRIFKEDATNSQLVFSQKSDGSDRAETEKIKILDSGEIQIDAAQNVANFGTQSIITKGWLNTEFENFTVPSVTSLAEVPSPETGQVVLVGSVLNVYNGTVWIPVNPM